MSPDTVVPAAQPFPHLFEPATVNGVQLRNRIIMGSMHTGLENHARDTTALAAFYAERAAGGVGLIITGGFSPNLRGRLGPEDATFHSRAQIPRHRRITEAVHENGSRIALQILHAGRYGHHAQVEAPSAIQAPISPFTPADLSTSAIRRLIESYTRTALLAQEAGYDGVEIMGGEGYLINQFLAEASNQRSDEYGGSPEKRRRFAVEIVRSIRARLGEDFLVIFRLSMADLVPNSQTLSEILELATEIEAAGAGMINTDIGWHESRVPTIVTSVPRAAFLGFTRAVARHVRIPVAASNRINTPELAESILEQEPIEFISMARPLLADPDFAAKARADRSQEINTCIGCNQACLDHAFAGKKVTCLVNPRAGRETKLTLGQTRRRKDVAVIGAGPAGLSAAIGLAERGHAVTLYEAGSAIGGQFDIAGRIPGKEEFAETIRYFQVQIRRKGVQLRLNTFATAGLLQEAGHDTVVLATGVQPRIPAIPGVDHPSVMTYAQLVRGERLAGTRVAVIGAGGIGVDISEFLTHTNSPSLDLAAWQAEWGVTESLHAVGSLRRPEPEPSPREVFLLQRKPGKIGAGLGATTGWVHRAALKAKQVRQLSHVNYELIDDAGLHISFGPDRQEPQVLEVDSVILCAGQESVTELAESLSGTEMDVHIIGGAALASELDAKRAIRQGMETAAAV